MAPENTHDDASSPVVQVTSHTPATSTPAFDETAFIVSKVLTPAIERIERKLNSFDERYVQKEQYINDKQELAKDFERIDLQFDRSRSTTKWAVGVAVAASSAIVGAIALILSATGGA